MGRKTYITVWISSLKNTEEEQKSQFLTEVHFRYKRFMCNVLKQWQTITSVMAMLGIHYFLLFYVAPLIDS